MKGDYFFFGLRPRSTAVLDSPFNHLEYTKYKCKQVANEDTSNLGLQIYPKEEQEGFQRRKI